jgi:uncharacterized protein YegP (UPF0339 family)
MRKNPRFQLIRMDEHRFFWRLLGSNNVSLGSGSTGYRDVESCVAGIAWLNDNIVDLQADLHHKSGASWRWSLRSEHKLVATASHEYGRRIEASHSLDRFRAAVAAAAGNDAPDTVVDWRAKHGANSQNLSVNSFRDLRSP